MGKLANALRGNLNEDTGPRKGKGERQLDLFLTLSERQHQVPKSAPASYKPLEAPPEPVTAAEPEPVLPASGSIPDVTADVRAVLSDPDAALDRDWSDTVDSGKPALRTGVYRRPRRKAPPPPPVPVARPPRPSPLKWVAQWLEGAQLDRRMISALLVLIVLVALVAMWSACPRQIDPGFPADLNPMENTEQAVGEAPALFPASPLALPTAPVVPAVAPASSPAAPVSPGTAPAVPGELAVIRIPGAITTVSRGESTIRFEMPVFVSADHISIEGMEALRALAAQLVEMKGGARVVVTGHTDDEPLGRPTARFRNNADLAAARAKAAREHLEAFSRPNARLSFEERTGSIQEAPYPNDSPANRRLNRTVTVRVIPSPPAGSFSQ